MIGAALVVVAGFAEDDATTGTLVTLCAATTPTDLGVSNTGADCTGTVAATLTTGVSIVWLGVAIGNTVVAVTGDSSGLLSLRSMKSTPTVVSAATATPAMTYFVMLDCGVLGTSSSA